MINGISKFFINLQIISYKIKYYHFYLYYCNNIYQLNYFMSHKLRDIFILNLFL